MNQTKSNQQWFYRSSTLCHECSLNHNKQVSLFFLQRMIHRIIHTLKKNKTVESRRATLILINVQYELGNCALLVDKYTYLGNCALLADKYTYLGSSILSTDTDINTRFAKALAVIDMLSVTWKLDQTDKMKSSFFQAVVVSIRLYGAVSKFFSLALSFSLSLSLYIYIYIYIYLFC